MAWHAIGAPCSPYLSKPLRPLRAACAEMAREHGLAAPPCGTCELADMCGPPPRRGFLPVPRTRRLGRPAPARPWSALGPARRH